MKKSPQSSADENGDFTEDGYHLPMLAMKLNPSDTYYTGESIFAKGTAANL